MINVKNGTTVKGDGSHGDTLGIQAFIDARGGALYFPPGRYRITNNLTIPSLKGTGHHWVASGLPKPVPDIGSEQGAESVIVWGGDDGGTMIEYSGTGLVWNGLTLWGSYATDDDPMSNCPTPQGNPRAGVGIKICSACPVIASSSSSSDPVPLGTAGKMWLPAIVIENCDRGIHVDASLDDASSCAFGYYWPRACGTCLQLDAASAMMFTFRYLHPLSCTTVFKVNGGGRIYTHSINVVLKATGGTILDVQGGTKVNSFYPINGMTGDGGVADYRVLKNVDDGDGLQHFRFTNAHLLFGSIADPLVAKVNIDRTGGNGQSVLELVGCRGLADGNQALEGNVIIKGASASKPSRLIVRDSGIGNVTDLIAAGSSDYSVDGIANWTYAAGVY